MSRPTSVSIMGMRYRIKYLQDLVSKKRRTIFGRCDDWRGVIEINASAPKEQIEETLIHEVVEGINDALDLELRHTQIQSIARGLWVAGLRVGKG